MDKYGRWKNAVEGNGLRMDVNKNKRYVVVIWKKSSVSKVDPCVVCGERVGCKEVYTRSEVGSLLLF